METGLPEMDAQHRRLFDLAASFDELKESGHVLSALAELADYVRTHFRDEEALLIAHRYPQFEVHRALHDQFRRMLADLVAQARQMPLEQVGERVRYLINDWFYKHILVADLEYAHAINTQSLP